MYILFHTMQLHDTQGKRLYLTADERRAFMAAASKVTICGRPHEACFTRGCKRQMLDSG